MAVKFNLRLCLQLMDQGISLNTISKQYHISKHTSSKVKRRKEELEFDTAKLECYSDTELGKLFFPNLYESEDIYAPIDYEYIHNELSKPGVTLKLLWNEYCIKINDGKYPVSYSKFCRGYTEHVQNHNYTNHIQHKPGIRTEVDWSGPTMHYTVPSTGEVVKVYLFVATLPFSQYSYVEATKDMKMNTWINCNRHMFEYFGGSTVRVVCDNLKTGVVMHPKNGEIILTDTYSDFGNHYMTAIMPAQVRKPKQKASVEGTVGKIATVIIASLRNREFNSFEELYKAVRERLEVFNSTPFQKRDGSRKEVFEEVEKKTLRPLPEFLLMCDKEAIEVQKILPFLSDTWPLCRIGRAVIRASQSCRQSCNKSQCPACGCRSRHSCTHAQRFSQSSPARGWGSIPQRQGAFGRYP